ncbi:MAG: FHA domain-containing protein [Myxococcales bacterium]|nr:FHA domain-containing protein [Myxococcales bacterium]
MGDARGKHRPRGVMYVGNDTSTCELVHVTSKTAYVVANLPASVGGFARISVTPEGLAPVDFDGIIRSVGEQEDEAQQLIELALHEPPAETVRLLERLLGSQDKLRAVTPVEAHHALPAKITIVAVYLGRRLIALHSLARSVTTVGRASESSILLDDATVSRKHCRIVERDDGLWIVDDGAANRTLLNNVPVARAPLSRGDEVTLGKFLLVFDPTPSQLGKDVVEALDMTPAGEITTQALDEAQLFELWRNVADERGAHLKRLDSSGLELGKPLLLDKARFVLARDPGADIELKAGGWLGLRKAHIELVRVISGRDELHRLEAKSGGSKVRINDKPIAGSPVLKNEDVLQIGDERFRYYQSVERKPRDDSTRGSTQVG